MDSFATPALVIDATTVFRNIERMATYAADHDLDVRPHTKTHKSRQMAALQMSAGAIGLTAAKVGEVELMAEVADDVLLAYPAVDPARTTRLVQLAAHGTIRVAVDSKDCAKALGDAANRHSATIGILVDLDVGMGRTGPANILRSPEAGPICRRHVRFASRWLVLLPGPHRFAAGRAGSGAFGRLRQAGRDAQAVVRSRPAGPHRFRRLLAHGLPIASDTRIHRDPPGHVHLQRHEHGSRRLLQLGRLCGADRLHGRQHRRAGSGGHRRGQQDPDQRSVRTCSQERIRACRRVPTGPHFAADRRARTGRYRALAPGHLRLASG